MWRHAQRYTPSNALSEGGRPNPARGDSIQPGTMLRSRKTWWSFGFTPAIRPPAGPPVVADKAATSTATHLAKAAR
jgi:hypothetical protein